MGVANKKTYGNKGDSHPYEFRSLQQLKRIENAIGGAGTVSTVTSIGSNTAVQTLLAANANRISVKITNDGANTLYVREGAGAAVGAYTWKLLANEMAIIDDYDGIITGIWDVATGDAIITETT